MPELLQIITLQLLLFGTVDSYNLTTHPSNNIQKWTIGFDRFIIEYKLTYINSSDAVVIYFPSEYNAGQANVYTTCPNTTTAKGKYINITCNVDDASKLWLINVTMQVLSNPLQEASVKFEHTDLITFPTYNVDFYNFSTSYCPDIPASATTRGIVDATYQSQLVYQCESGQALAQDGVVIHTLTSECGFDTTWNWTDTTGSLQCWFVTSLMEEITCFSCELLGGSPNVSEVVLSLGDYSASNRVMNGDALYLNISSMPAYLNNMEVTCTATNDYATTSNRSLVHVLYEPQNNTQVLFAPPKLHESLTVSFTLFSNPAVNKSYANLTDQDGQLVNDSAYSLETESDGVTINFIWLIQNFTESYESNYTFKAWSPHPEITTVLQVLFHLHIGSTAGTVITTAPATTSTASKPNNSNNIIIIVAAVAGGFLLIAVIVVVVLLCRRCSGNADKVERENELYATSGDVGNLLNAEKEEKANVLYGSHEVNGNSGEMKTNVIYESSETTAPSTSADVYSEVVKSKPKQVPVTDVYSEVDKSKKNGKVNEGFSPEATYTAVQKKPKGK